MYAGPNDLTTVAAAAAYLGPNLLQALDANSAAAMQVLVTALSAQAQKYMSRTIALATYTGEQYNGTGTSRLPLRQGPVTGIASVLDYATSVQPITVQPSTGPLAWGWALDNSSPENPILRLINGVWTPGALNVQVTYTAGYSDGLVTAEPVNVSAVAPYTASLTQGFELRAILTLAYSSGTPFVSVGSSPARGQYQLIGSTLYFNSADASQGLVCSYTTNGTPADIAQAVNLWVGYAYARRGRPDKKSEGLAQQTVAYDLKGVPDTVKQALNPHRRMGFY